MTSPIKPLAIIESARQIMQAVQELLDKLPDVSTELKEEADNGKDKFECPLLELFFQDSYEDVLKMSDEERHKRMMENLRPPGPPGPPGPIKFYDFH